MLFFVLEKHQLVKNNVGLGESYYLGSDPSCYFFFIPTPTKKREAGKEMGKRVGKERAGQL